MKHFQLTILVGIITLLLVTGCAQTQKTKELSKFKISVNSWVGFAPFYLAQEKGFFKDEGLDVEITVMEGQPERVSAITSGAIDAYGDTVDLLVLTKAEDVPTTAVSLLDFSYGGDGIVATDSIKKLSDLKGKKVAVQKNFVGESFLLYLLQQGNISSDDLTMVDMESGAAGAAFVAGQVDAAVTFEPWLGKAKTRQGGHILISSKDEPGIIVDLLSVNNNVLKTRPSDVKALERAWFKAVDYWKNNPKEADAIMAKQYDMSANDFADTISGLQWPDYDKNKEYFGTQDNPGKIYEIAKTFSNIFAKAGTINHEPEMTTAIDRGILQSLYS